MSYIFKYNTNKIISSIKNIAGANLTEKLNNAIAYIDEGGTIDLSNSDGGTITLPININKNLTIIFPSEVFNYTGAAGTDMFSIQATGVTLKGTGRSPKGTELIDVTRFIMSSGRYHIHSRGNSQITLKGFDCIGVASDDLETFNNHAGSGDLSGSGGIYLEKPNPGTVGGGNTISNLLIEDIYIEGSYAHGLYIDTPILANIRNVRTSQIRGFGFYQNGGTSTVYERCFSASAYQGGFLFQSCAYSEIRGCASEAAGVGYWIRSCQGFTASGSGAESCKNIGSSVPGILLETLADDDLTVVDIDDMSSDFQNELRGTSWLISGGRSIVLSAPFSTNIGLNYDSGITNTCRHFQIVGNTRGATIINPRLDISSGNTVENRFDWEIDELGVDLPSNIVVFYNPTDGTIIPLHTTYFTPNNIAGESTYIRSDSDDVIFIAGATTFDPVSNPGVV